jgi:hypothetical protein
VMALQLLTNRMVLWSRVFVFHLQKNRNRIQKSVFSVTKIACDQNQPFLIHPFFKNAMQSKLNFWIRNYFKFGHTEY